MTKISLNENPYLMCLAREGETIEDLRKLSPEELLLRWVNYQLEQNENYEGGPISNFSRDIKDSVAYQYLMEQIQPKNTGLVANPSEKDLHDRAENTLQMADRIDCREFVTPADIVKGQPRLNLAFVANLFNNHPNLKPMEVEEITETMEEKTYRNWMNVSKIVMLGIGRIKCLLGSRFVKTSENQKNLVFSKYDFFSPYFHFSQPYFFIFSLLESSHPSTTCTQTYKTASPS